ncbi:MAG TPA: NlpC/P60 family protein [Pseudonocardiaceae bacterium]|nr:NlpC/P60 family protein [Pseudonocardiaceae bacterium]
MASHRLKRTMRGAIAATAVLAAAAVSFTPSAATADPASPPANSDPVAQYTKLSQQADALNEKMDTANVNLARQQALARKASAGVVAAKKAEQAALAKENSYLNQVDKLTDASFEGARLDQLSALFTGTSARDFLNRATALQDLAADNFATLSKFAAAVNAAKAAEQQAQHDLTAAQDATAAAKRLQQQLVQQGKELQRQITQLVSAKNALSPSELAQLANKGVDGVFIAPPGVRGEAMTIALAQRGKPYIWAAAGPNSFDCSGLVIYSYAHAGMPGLPHSSAELSRLGQPVSRADLQPGDLVFFGAPVHHVGIYVGNGLMVNAPNFGEVVKVEPLFSDYSGARRLGA